MNFLDIKAGDNIEVGTQVAFRFWRYVFPPHEAPLRLLSWVSNKRWRYRAQFARPISFISSYGKRSQEALAELRTSFLK